MLRTRVVAVLLAVALMFCGLVISASAENETCVVSVTLSGDGIVSVDGVPELSDHFDRTYYMGTTVTLTAEAADGFEFLFWVNSETSRIVSWDATYSFAAATYSRLEAVFDEDETDAAEDGRHTVIYLSESDNIVFMQPVDIDDASYYDQVNTVSMFVVGKTFVDWDKDATEVAATSGRVFVRPVYSTDPEFKYTVTSIINGVETTDRVQYRTTKRLVAPPRLNNQEFSYWIALAKDENSVDEIASYYATYSFIVTMDVTLEAVYGVSYDDDPDAGIAARISGDFPSFNESTVTIYAEHSVVPEYTVLQHGMLLTKDEQIGSFDEQFRINPAETKIIKGTSGNTLLAGTYSLTIGNWTQQDAGSYTYYPKIYARAYVIATDQNGVTHTKYSAVYCVDYVQGTGNMGGDNNDDPYG